MRRSIWLTTAACMLMAVACGDGDVVPSADGGHDAGDDADRADAVDASDASDDIWPEEEPWPDSDAGLDGGAPGPQTLFATEGDTLVAFDLESGVGKPGAILNVVGPRDMLALQSGHIVVTLAGRNEVLVVNARTLTEVARIPGSPGGGLQPGGGYVTPLLDGKQFLLANHDGSAGMAVPGSLRFIDLVPQSATFLQAVGEIALGGGIHKNAVSPNRARVSVSNFGDCDNVIDVIDYGDAKAPVSVRRWSAAALNPTVACARQAAAPRGAAAARNGRAYHNLSGWGVIVAVDQDAAVPSAKVLATRGSGGGQTKTGADGRYLYALQSTPREGDATTPGVDCQIGNLVVIDSTVDDIVGQVPILLTGPSCAAKLPLHAVAAVPDDLQVSRDGKTLFVSTQATRTAAGAAYSDQLVVFDLGAPEAPVQLPSIRIGRHSGPRPMSLSGDGQFLIVVSGNDLTLSQIEVADRRAMRAIQLAAAPGLTATWGEGAGPSAQNGPPASNDAGAP